MIRKIKYFIASRRAMKAGMKKVSPEQAVEDYERFRRSGLQYPYEKGAIRAGKSLRTMLDGKPYRLTHDGRSGSCYSLPEKSIFESDDGDTREFTTNYLPGKEFYQ